MKFTEVVNETAAQVIALAERTARLRDFRRHEGRRLSAATRGALLSMAGRLRATADRLDEVAENASLTAEEVADLVAQARAAGVPL